MVKRFPFAVIWNPWADKARETPDFGDDEYPNMICVESGHVSSPVILLPGTAFEASQILQVGQPSLVVDHLSLSKFFVLFSLNSDLPTEKHKR
jgi:Aldose 1-epimerase